MGRHDVKSTKRTREKTERKRLAELPLAPAAGEKNAPPASTGGSVTWPRRPRRSPGLNDIVPGKSMASDAPAQDISADPSPSGRGKLKWPVRPRPQRSARLPDLREGGGAERSEQISRRPRPAEEKTPDRAERVKGAEAKSVPFSKTEREKPRPAAPEPRENVSASRPEKSPEKKEPWPVRFLRVILAAGICALAAGFYFLWARQGAEEAMPPLFMPQPYFYEEEQPVHALLLWHEKVLTAPSPGTVQLAYGGKLAAVADDEVVATVLARGRTITIRTPARGYFLPAIDGAEDRWDYPTLWLGSGLLPKAPELRWIEDLKPLDTAVRAVGKLIYLPQEPRAIFYLELTDRLRAGLERGSISIRRESKGPKWTARVRVYVKYGDERAKVALDMPYFPMDMALSREVDFLVCSDEDAGLVVPDSAVTIRHGTYGVFELVGDRLVFRSVTGKPIEDGRFFIASGLSAGNPVILEAANAEEKRVRLW
ncbi:hypothetical protein [uncultured Pyramidobacter sp.]|uniref:hypothetical protein n=1 Tax=uncultured Pyramidobacter sp. TaxID=1623495 RepID=UPI00258A436B|nr:hypothetical protein [uncultured Pyramidobacter sp.]